MCNEGASRFATIWVIRQNIARMALHEIRAKKGTILVIVTICPQNRGHNRGQKGRQLQIAYPRYTIRGLIHGTIFLLSSITSSYGGRFFTKEGNFLLIKLIVLQNTL
jgi:hypothetical protein